MVGELEKRPCNTCLEREEAHRRDLLVGLPQSRDERVHEIEDGLFAARNRPRRSPRVARVQALGPFEEYYISYQDRTVACPPEHLAAVGPGKNGMVRPILLADGVVVGTWRHSTAAGRHREDPVPELFAPVSGSGEDVAAALDRYAAFITG